MFLKCLSRPILATAIAVSATSPALACDMVPGSEVQSVFSEKVPGWMVWKFTPLAKADGHMITGNFKRQSFPQASQEKAFLETEIGKAAAALYKTRPTRVTLDGPSTPLPPEALRSRTSGRAFTLTLDFGGQSLAAPGVMRINPARKDISLIVAFADPAKAATATQIAQRTAAHPGFDCTAGDGP